MTCHIPPRPKGDPERPTRCGVWYREGVRPPDSHATHVVTWRIGGIVGFVMFCGSWRRAIDVSERILTEDSVEVRALCAEDY